uniref:Uncharacterized protein n=1 Tax=Arundo donax TaxID=35708 RepID=A0A0A9B485_ARUDO
MHANQDTGNCRYAEPILGGCCICGFAWFLRNSTWLASQNSRDGLLQRVYVSFAVPLGIRGIIT